MAHAFSSLDELGDGPGFRKVRGPLGVSAFGVNGVVGAFCIVPTAFAAVLLVAGAGRGWGPIARELARDGLRFVALAAVSFGIGAAIADSLIFGLAAPLLAIGIGGILYRLITSQLPPRHIRLLVGAVRPASAEA